MTTIRLKTFVPLPPQRCFDLSRSVTVHLQSTAHTRERMLTGPDSDLLKAGDEITWQAVHFGIRQRLTVRITAMQAPDFFVDEMVRGAFKSLWHRHDFRPHGDGTLMTDTFRYETPLGPAGHLFDLLFLKRHMLQLLQRRNDFIRTAAAGSA